MELFLLFSVLISLAAIFSYINVRFLRLPSGISLMLMGSFVAMMIIALGHFSADFSKEVASRIALIDFSEFILGILLSFLLFAGALHVQLEDLKKSAKSITVFSIFSTLLSTFLVGVSLFWLSDFFNQPMPLIYCLLLGALISPTDPIAVIGILKKTKLPKSIETNIVGESLFNDGIGVVVFATLLQIATSTSARIDALDIFLLFLREAGGGLLAGLVIGYVGYRLMKSIDHFQTEILISLAMVMGGYSLCHAIHVSGPLAMVVAGIITGNRGKTFAMSDMTRDYLGKFWEVTDEILNAILFMLIGLEIVVVRFEPVFLATGIVVALLVIVARFLSLYFPSRLFRLQKQFNTKTLAIMTWGGLRGGISIALALSLPSSSYKPLIVSVTFVIVLFSILFQGLSIERLIRKLGS